jgi:hypothetical protein
MTGAAVMLSFVWCASVSADPASPVIAVDAIPAFEALDRNADRRLSRSEAGFDRQFSGIFVACDEDGDGYVTPAEYAKGTGKAPAAPVNPVVSVNL